MIGIVDYGTNNILSVKKAFEYLNVECKIIRSQNDFTKIKKVVLPGVGAFGEAVKKLKSKEIYRIIEEWIFDDRPFLGICLGMQLLFEKSEESQGVKGFAFFNDFTIFLMNFGFT